MRAIAILLLALVAGCAGRERHEAPLEAAAPSEEPIAETPVFEMDFAAIELPMPVAPGPAAAKATAPAAKTVRPPAEASVKVLPSSPPTEPVAAIPDAPKAAAKTAHPLDVADLKARLRDTHAIGVLTKLALRNQMD